jgi:phage terminase small subunit
MHKLTEKQSKFCEEYVKNGYNGSAAYRVAYDQNNKLVCGSESHRLLKNPKIQEEINNVELTFGMIGKMAGLDKKAIVEILKKMMVATKIVYDKGNRIDEVPDWTAINNAITTFSRLSGEFTERKKIIIEDNSEIGDVDPTKLTEEEREELREKILKDL